jgi:transcription initiation factor TFIID subunit 4
MPSLKSEKKSLNVGGSYSSTGDEDINDVATMGGVNLAEESQRMQGATDMLIGTQIRSCKDETFLQTGQLHHRIARICREHGLDEPPASVVALVSHATQERLKTLLEKLNVIAEHRLDIVKSEGDYEVTQDVRGQIRFLGELDKIERKRHEEAERELLLRAAKSRTKTEDPEKEKLKAKAKELQRIEEDQQRYEKANNTALMAIGMPKKKMRLDDSSATSGAVSSAFGTKPLSGVTARPRTKRVHLRDLLFLMEQEKELKRSPLLWKAYSS